MLAVLRPVSGCLFSQAMYPVVCIMKAAEHWQPCNACCTYADRDTISAAGCMFVIMAPICNECAPQQNLIHS